MSGLPHPGGSRGWYWTRIRRQTRRVVVTQLDEDGCGPACGEMLLRDRDVGVDQATIGARLELPVVAPALAERLSSLSGLVWRGGALYVPGVVDWELIAHISDTRGTWAALLEPHGPRHVGHWVVVDGISEDGIVRVRDPVGEAYGIPLAEFLSLWEFTVVVMEETSR